MAAKLGRQVRGITRPLRLQQQPQGLSRRHRFQPAQISGPQGGGQVEEDHIGGSEALGPAPLAADRRQGLAPLQAQGQGAPQGVLELGRPGRFRRDGSHQSHLQKCAGTFVPQAGKGAIAPHAAIADLSLQPFELFKQLPAALQPALEAAWQPRLQGGPPSAAQPPPAPSQQTETHKAGFPTGDGAQDHLSPQHPAGKQQGRPAPAGVQQGGQFGGALGVRRRQRGGPTVMPL